MAKKLNDLKKDSLPKIDLSDGFSKKEKDSQRISQKRQKVLNKIQEPIHKIGDLKSDKNYNFNYFKGKDFNPPKYLGNLLKVSFIGFFIIFFLNTINVYYSGKTLQDNISGSAFEGYNLLVSGGKDATKIQFNAAEDSFESALESFQSAEEELWFINQDVTFYSDKESVANTVKNLLEGGQHFAAAGSYFLEALEEFNKLPLYFVANNNPSIKQKPSLSNALTTGLSHTEKAIEEISKASEKIQSVNENILPPDIRHKVVFAKDKINEISGILNTTSEHFPAILKLLGDKTPHTYLVLFQNNDELRPTGGFIGSYALIDINDGQITKLETHDSYELDGSYTAIIEPPAEFKEFTNNWRFRDSNYWPDFPLSAQKARWFLQKQGGPTADTVIAINQGLLEDLLEITGPVQVGRFGELTSENYRLLLSYVIESKAFGPEDPKHILKVFVPAFQEAILKEEYIGPVSSKLFKAIQQKHIMVYSSDEDVQALFDALAISGRSHQPAEKEDFLSVINISTGGTKTDRYINENIIHETHINSLGEVINQVTVKKTHQWNEDLYAQWLETLNEYGFSDINQETIYILGRGRNRSNIRIYVPKDVRLIDASNEEIELRYDADLKKHYFYTTMEINPGESDKFWIKYKMPFRLDLEDPADTYKLIIEKQPGSKGSIFTKTVTSDEDVYNLGIYPNDGIRIDGTDRIIYATNLVYDRYFSAVFAKE